MMGNSPGRIATLLEGEVGAGNHSLEFDASGIYVYGMQAGDFVDTRRFVLVR